MSKFQVSYKTLRTRKFLTRNAKKFEKTRALDDWRRISALSLLLVERRKAKSHSPATRTVCVLPSNGCENSDGAARLCGTLTFAMRAVECVSDEGPPFWQGYACFVTSESLSSGAALRVVGEG